MSNLSYAVPVEHLEQSFDFSQMFEAGAVTSEDVRQLRAAFFQDGVISTSEAAVLLQLGRHCETLDADWPQFMIDALTDYLVHQAEPAGYVTVENADWLIATLSSDESAADSVAAEGGLSATELALLVEVMSEARYVPDSLIAFALAAVRESIVTSQVPLAAERTEPAGVVSASDVALLRQVLYAAGGDGHIAISRAEADLLFDIDVLTAGSENHEEWQDLFVKAIANHVLWVSGYRPPSRAEALDRDRWLRERDGVTGFLKRMIGTGTTGIISAYTMMSSQERALARLEDQHRALVVAEEITPAEAEWLIARLRQNGKPTPNGKALMAFLKAESSNLAPAFQEFVRKGY